MRRITLTTQPFFSTGCTLLDCVLGGGYARGRVVNIVGDRSTGKTLLAIEACANFARTVKGGNIRYLEAEAAFDQKYAESLGLPTKHIDLSQGKIDTVEGLFEDIDRWIRKKKGEGLYIVDSLDALSDREEKSRKVDEGSYGTQKAKKLSELFRRLNQDLHTSKTTLIILSQVRDRIGVTFGKRQTRSGGKALDFYASQILWLAEVGKLIKKVGNVERPVGIKVLAKNEKNKVGTPYRSCTFPILFHYGIDDLAAGVEWMISVNGKHGEYDSKNFRKLLSDLKGEDRRAEAVKINQEVVGLWQELENKFLPQEHKYL